ncbi:MAG: SgcJ/EcaC family oxidoreductase, partial [Spiribacter salinus]
IMLRGKMEQGRYADAQSTAERALEADPSFAPAQNQLGYIALQAGDHARAERAFQEYIRLAPDQPNPYDSLGELYVEMGRYDEGIAQLDKALALNPTFPPSITRRAQANIEKANRRLTAAFAAQDADAIAAGFTPNGMLLPPDGLMVVGTEEIRALYASAFAGSLDNIEVDTREVQVLGEMALEFGRFVVRTGETIAEEGTYDVLWDPSGDTWKIHREIWNATPPSDTPPSTMSAE